ncbi:MAG: phosphotransferase family protein [Alphaproteobacteria bacterium]|nr:phosphotransferase family protein [Alphaproteobacteria bacterium]
MTAAATVSADAAERLRTAIERAVRREVHADAAVAGLRRLSAGASRETWRFELRQPDAPPCSLVLKRDPPDEEIAKGDWLSFGLSIERETEARLMAAAHAHGLPVPRLRFILRPEDGGGRGFVMDYVAGETLGRRIVRDGEFTAARPRLTFQCGETLARLHALPPAALPPLPSLPPGPHLKLYRDLLAAFDWPHPGFTYGLKWLEERLALVGRRQALVHGDFRNGNLVVGPEGLRAVLDWEIGHLGDPLLDLGWLCVKSWRYGRASLPVGGFGRREELFAGYESAGGGRVDSEAVRFWEIFGCIRWGIMCLRFGFNHLAGVHRSIEWAAIARRAAETEYDLLQLID